MKTAPSRTCARRSEQHELFPSPEDHQDACCIPAATHRAEKKPAPETARIARAPQLYAAGDDDLHPFFFKSHLQPDVLPPAKDSP